MTPRLAAITPKLRRRNVRREAREHHGFVSPHRVGTSAHGAAQREPPEGARHDALLRALIDYAGPDHVLLGSDYPFDMGDQRHVDTVRGLGLAPDVEAAILAGNAERLLTT